MRNFLFVALTAGAGFASAQTLSASCQDSLTGLLSDPDAACLNIAALLQLPITEDVPATLDNWLSGLCTNGECSQESLANIVASLTEGCSQEITMFGFPAGIAQEAITSVVQSAFPTARRALCLKDTTSDTFCPVEFVSDFESVMGKIQFDDLTWVQNLMALYESGEIPANITCTDCMSSVVAVIEQDLDDPIFEGEVSSIFTDTCGADFLTDQVSTGVEETASTAQFSADADADADADAEDSSNAALTLFVPTAWAMAFISIAFALF